MSVPRSAWLVVPSSRAWRGCAVVVAAFALLMQVVLAAPVALRMSAEPGMSPFGGILCGVADAGHPGGHAPARQPMGHDHGHCLLCGSAAVPLAWFAAAPFVPPTRRVGAASASAGCGGAAQGRLFDAYSSRAPPAGA